MMWLKACPRCGGDIFDEKDNFGEEITCLQCGHSLTEKQKVILMLVVNSMRRPATNSDLERLVSDRLKDHCPPDIADLKARAVQSIVYIDSSVTNAKQKRLAGENG